MDVGAHFIHEHLNNKLIYIAIGKKVLRYQAQPVGCPASFSSSTLIIGTCGETTTRVFASDAIGGFHQVVYLLIVMTHLPW